MGTVHDWTDLRFDPEARRTLRQVGFAASERPASPDLLQRALDQPSPEPLPFIRFRIDEELEAVIELADRLAREQQSEQISRAHLQQALRESRAAALGLNLHRLRFLRWLVHRDCAVEPRLRSGSISLHELEMEIAGPPRWRSPRQPA